MQGGQAGVSRRNPVTTVLLQMRQKTLRAVTGEIGEIQLFYPSLCIRGREL
jgi:hypothetical protein